MTSPMTSLAVKYSVALILSLLNITIIIRTAANIRQKGHKPQIYVEQRTPQYSKYYNIYFKIHKHIMNPATTGYPRLNIFPLIVHGVLNRT